MSPSIEHDTDILTGVSLSVCYPSSLNVYISTIIDMCSNDNDNANDNDNE